MEMNKNIESGRWLVIKGDIQKAWGKLTDDELEQTKGEMKSIGGLIQRKYGQTVDSYDEKIKAIFSKFSDTSDKENPDSRLN